MTVAYGTTIVNNGLITLADPANPRSYIGTGTVFNDISGNKNNLTMNVSPTYSSSNGGIFTYNGTSTYIYTSPFGTLSTGFTYSAWFNSSSANGVILTEQGNLGLNTSWHDSQMEIVSGTIRISVCNNQPGLAVTSYTTGTWCNFTTTYNATTITGYMNGVYANSTAMTRQLPSTTYLAIGAGDSTNLGSGAYFTGSIGPVLVYNRPLAVNEILQNFNAYRGRFGL